ncbi:MAG: MFS transporter [Pelagibacteraceae bacterium BACL5 MAG-120705-bin12]|jgi:MFS family permease|uniref:MFS transporter n=2 Tax=Candidatus Pelagibacter sp. TaxID=2024849 RepID=UPI000715FCA1|nr:MAG: MFS transporter [Pelagibacteraceae bacterium BACL5 MAG-121015-bin10]KRO60872.1 MAG: MFS transporter [Pelagibacteraceae bacterium BACL5 MAG-120705-bin12]KRO63919.1 MAG: MFS transporter [Pelagibacteraceae bacterium BACL5 MAG-120820-bin39]KRO74908.1 MAG: MFS transporter [Pelagibacteraceae bacterium BACL5 MAG-120813-bin20]MDA1167217.1 MFS transporter [Pseudomonadota bacterium]
MNKILKNSWALFLGISLLMVAHGFQGSLLGVRAVQEQFSVTATGFMLSGYYIGYFIGAKTIPTVIGRVGHIRAFAAFASLASIAILLHSVIINPFTWFLLRVVTGISLVSIYTICESWLNDRSTNNNRGSVLSLYMIILYGSMALGMFLLNFSAPTNFQPFILISLLMSIALIPILLTKRKAPNFKSIQGMSLKDLYKVSPLGMVSSLLYGTVQSALFALLAVYAASMNFSILEISIVTFLLAISGALSQWPIGKLSDNFDRRKVITYATFIAAFFAFCAMLSTKQMYLPGDLATSKFWFYIFLVLFSFASLPMFAIIFAHTNDFIPKEKFVAAGAGLQFAYGLGAMSGPLLCSILMNIIGSNGYFIFIMFFHILIGVFALHRMRVRNTEDNPDSQFTPMPHSITPVGMELNPTTEPIAEPVEEETEEVKPAI